MYESGIVLLDLADVATAATHEDDSAPQPENRCKCLPRQKEILCQSCLACLACFAYTVA